MLLIRMKSGVFIFYAPNMIVRGSMSILSKREMPDTHSLNSSSKLLITAHAQNKCSTDSFSVSHREHKGLSTILNLNNFYSSPRYCSKFCTGMNVGMTQLLLETI